MSTIKRIAVIGAGASGLTAIKCCLEAGFAPVCYERNADPGGLWRFHEEDVEGVASVMRTTIMNTSKELSAFSDFPPPAHLPNFMHNSQMFDYFMMYAEKFKLLEYIRYHLEVIKVEPSPDFVESGRWMVSVRSTQTNAVTREQFDGVLVCMGHHVYPKIPNFPGQENFQGTITHTHSLKNCDQYVGQKVVVIGIGNSGVDAAVDCTYVAQQVYLSTRRGSWILGRIGPNGVPSDLTSSVRKQVLLRKLRSFDAICEDLEQQVNAKFDHATYGLRPKHRILSAHPTLNDHIPSCILSGRVIVKGDIERFDDNGVVFAGDGGKVTPADSVILATGYQLKFSFLDSNIMSTEDNRINLYKYTFPPRITHHTLAIIGAIQPIGPIFPVSEMQCRWFCQLMSGKAKLPSVHEMEADIAKKNEANAKRYVASTRHTVQADWIPFMDELASLFGAKPNFFKMAFTDPELFWACMNGPCFPYQYRLQGPNAWPGARDAVLSYHERVYAPLNSEGRLKRDKRNKIITGHRFLLLLLVSVASMFYGRKYLESFDPKEYFGF